jgi:hypothetical protein
MARSALTVEAEACRKHTLSPNLLGLWKATVLERAHALFQPDEQRDEDQARIAELEQMLGRGSSPTPAAIVEIQAI